MEMEERILTKNACYKQNRKIQVKGLMLHSVGCPQPSAEVFIRQWNSENSPQVCIHAFIDANTGKVYQTLPWDHRAWHCGGSGNNTHIGVEMCEPPCIKYTGGCKFQCSDQAAAEAYVKRAYDAAVELFAWLCSRFQLDPLGDGVIISHNEGHKRGIASGHADPEHLWSGLNLGYSMDGFRKAVYDAMKAAGNTVSAPVNPSPVSSGTASASTDSADFKVGDAVRLAADAIYYTGKEMPDWVKSDIWVIKSIAGDRVVIDKNLAGTKSISSPIHVKYLQTAQGVQVGGCTQSVSEPPSGAATQANAGEKKISETGLELIARYEGCRLQAYKCPSGVWTIGYGHTEGVKEGDTLPSIDAAKALLAKDLEKYGGYVNTCVKKGILSFTPNQNQFDALTSFTYNCGNGSLQKLVSGRTAEQIAEVMLQYNKGGGKVLPGLVKRRTEEHDLFLKA